MKTLLTLIGLTIGSLALAAEPAAMDVLRVDNEGVAIDGYSPVSYFVNDAAEPGDPSFAATHEGAIYWMTDADQLARFEADPTAFVPAHGGWCSLMLSGSGNRTPANPETWKIVDGQLLMFWSGTYKDMDINGLSNWESKTGGKEKKELKRLASANKTWAGIVEGSKSAPIILFNERDETLISDHQQQFVKR